MNYPEIVRYVASGAEIIPHEQGEWYRAARQLMRFQLDALTSPDAHIFEIERDLAFLMSVTDNDGLGPDTHLPFPFTFLDLDCELDLNGNTKRIVGLLLIEHPLLEDGGIISILYWREPSGRLNAGSYALGMDWRETAELTMGFYEALAAGGDDAVPPPTKEEMREDRIEMAAIKSMVQNFLDMLDSKDVRISCIDARGPDSKRVRKGKMPLPPRSIVRMALPLRSYVAELKHGATFSYDHAFWVRGHWRHYRAERYASSGLIGTKKYIWPYVKGKGLLVRKKYQVEGPEQS